MKLKGRSKEAANEV